MADFTDSSESLVIVVDVETEAAKKKLKQWNKELSKAATDAEKAEKLLSIATDKAFLKKSRGSKTTDRKKYRADIKKIQEQAKALATAYLPKSSSRDVDAVSDIEKITKERLKEQKAAAKDLEEAYKKVTYLKSNKTYAYRKEIEQGKKTTTKSKQKGEGTAEDVKEIVEKAKGTFIESGKMLGDVFSSKILDDKTVTKTEEIADGLKTVREYATLTNGELYLMSQNITKVKEKTEKVKAEPQIKGTKVDSLLGTTLLETKEADKTKIRTQEIADGFKTVREYIKLANGELYLMAEKTSAVKKEVKKTFKEKLKDNVFDGIGKNLQKQTKNFGNIFKRIGSIITYRVARTILSAFTNAIKQGFELLSQDNSTLGSIKDTFSSISTTMQVSLTTIMIPLFETLANLLKPIADDFLNFANAISYANAKLNGQSQYFELSKEKIDAYTKSLKNSNKQLSELDKFATLNGSSKADLGGYVDIADASKEIVENQDEYKNIVDFVQTISDIIGVIIKGAKDLFEFVRDNIDWLVPAIALVITAMNPLLGILGSIITLMSDAGTNAKLLAAACMTLAGAIIGIGIATHFAKNPLAGLAAGAIGGALFASIFAMIGDVNNGLNPFRAPSLNLSGTSLSGSSDLYSGIEKASTRAYSSSGATTVQGNVYIDGQKAGKIMSNSVFAEATRVGVFGGKK